MANDEAKDGVALNESDETFSPLARRAGQRKQRIGRTLKKGAVKAEALACEPHLLPHKKPREMDKECRALITEGLLKNRFCQQLDPAEVSEICNNMEYFAFDAGEDIVKQGDEGSYFFVLHEGDLQVVIDGKAVNTLGPGNAFGGIALLYDCPRTATVSAKIASGVWGVTGAVFQQVVQTNARKRLQENLQLLEQVSILDGLSAGQKANIGSNCLLNEKVAQNVVVAAEGELPKALYVVKSGKLLAVQGGKRLESGLIEGGTVVRELLVGHCFGEKALTKGGFLDSSLIGGSEESELVCISVNELSSIFGEDDLGLRLEKAFISSILRRVPLLQSLRSAQASRILNEFKMVDVEPEKKLDLGPSGSVCLAIVMDGTATIKGDEICDLERGWFATSPFMKQLGTDYNQAKKRPSLITAVSKSRNSSALGRLEDALEAGKSGARVAILPLQGFAVGISDADMAAEVIGLKEGMTDYIWKLMMLSQGASIFRALSLEQLCSLARALSTKTSSAGSTMKPDDLGEFVMVRSGIVDVEQDGTSFSRGNAGIFGDQTLLFNGKPPSSISVKEDCVLYCLQRSAFETVVSESMRNVLKQRANNHQTGLSMKKMRHVRLIGAGSFGSVRLVEHVKSNARYALKRIRKKNGEIPEDVRRETDLLSKTSHPFVLEMVTTFESANSIYILTELITGGQLHELTQGRTVNRKHAQFYIGSLCLIFENLHQSDIVYRDLKPENVMLDSQGYVKLVDFGLAKQLDQSHRTFTLVGTIYYMAPEVIQGKGYGKECDYWSLGVMLYEMVCGELPFGEDAPDENSILVSVVEEELVFPQKYNDNAGRKLIQALLKKSPQERLGANGWGEVKENKFFKVGEPKLFSKIVGRELAAPYIPPDEVYTHEHNLQEVTLSDSEELASQDAKDNFAERVSEKFKEFDKNGDGSIDLEELRAILKLIDAEFFTDEVCKVLMDEMDGDGNGEIDYKEFMDFLSSDDEDSNIVSKFLNLGDT